jgi:predicted CopG family antitoxin
MQDLQDLQLKTIAISKRNYEKLCRLGFTNESFNERIAHLVKKLENL